ncbi:MAG: winged-helix domain-containing protein [Ruminococcaceae bacterium]|nr:winged-helix domain-containing protein [Oscillospiraceae bacterium]
MRVAVITDDKYLFRLIELELSGNEVYPYSEGDTDNADAVILDLNSELGIPTTDIRLIRLCRTHTDGAISLPLPRGELRRLVEQDAPGMQLLPAERSVALDGRHIRLTAQEYKLLWLLYSEHGEYVSRERITKEVFGTGGDSLINVYIHYLRKKLESDGRRLIVASRKHGYKIDEKYVGGKQC